jgi:hypothetical protein
MPVQQRYCLLWSQFPEMSRQLADRCRGRPHRALRAICVCEYKQRCWHVGIITDCITLFTPTEFGLWAIASCTILLIFAVTSPIVFVGDPSIRCVFPTLRTCCVVTPSSSVLVWGPQGQNHPSYPTSSRRFPPHICSRTCGSLTAMPTAAENSLSPSTTVLVLPHRFPGIPSSHPCTGACQCLSPLLPVPHANTYCVLRIQVCTHPRHEY